MGARFSLSIVNLYMAKWEEEEILHNPPYQLKLYNRFIDDLILFWDGSEQKLHEFMMHMNNKSITLSWESSHKSIHFLDLEINNENNHIVTKTHFKTTDRNSYIPTYPRIAATINLG